MDDKIEAWRHGLLRLVLQHARAYADNSDPAKTEAAYVAICDYLRTTPEGYRLVPVEPTTCPIEDDIKHYEADDFDFSDMARVVRVSLRYAKTMPSGHDRCLLYTLAKYVERQLIAASQESGT